MYGVNGRLYHSVNGGSIWTPIDTISQNLCVAVDTVGTIYVGTQSSILISTDHGTSWTDIQFRKTRSIEVINDELYAGCDSGIYRRSGKTWTRLYDAFYIDAIAQSPFHELFLQSEGYLYKSIDSGKFWKKTYSTNYQITQFAFSTTHDVYVALAKDQGGNIDHSTDDGATWDGARSDLAQHS